MTDGLKMVPKDAYVVHGFRIIPVDGSNASAIDVMQNIPPWYIRKYNLIAVDNVIITFTPGARCVFGLCGDISPAYLALMCDETAHTRNLRDNVGKLLADGQEYGRYKVSDLSLYIIADGKIVGDYSKRYTMAQKEDDNEFTVKVNKTEFLAHMDAIRTEPALSTEQMRIFLDDYDREDALLHSDSMYVEMNKSARRKIRERMSRLIGTMVAYTAAWAETCGEDKE